MKRTILTLTAVAALALTGCGTTTGDSDAKLPADFDAPAYGGDMIEPLPEEDLMEEAFLVTIREEFPEFAASPDSEVIALGTAACEALDLGATMSDFADEAIAAGTDPGDLGFILGAAVPTFCPEHTDALPGGDSL